MRRFDWILSIRNQVPELLVIASRHDAGRHCSVWPAWEGAESRFRSSRVVRNTLVFSSDLFISPSLPSFVITRDTRGLCDNNRKLTIQLSGKTLEQTHCVSLSHSSCSCFVVIFSQRWQNHIYKDNTTDPPLSDVR